MPILVQKTRFFTKPPLGTPIDWGHPLSRGLVGAWLLNERGGNPTDLVNRVALAGSGTWSAHGLQTAGTGVGVEATLPTHLRLQAPLTVVWFGVRLGSNDSSAHIFGLLTNNSDSSPWVSACFQWDGSNTIRYIYNNGGFVYTPLGIGMTTNVPCMLVATHTPSGVTVYKDGAQVTTNGTTGTITYDSSALVAFGNYTGVNRNSNLDSIFGLLYNRALSAAEIRQLYADPYSFLRPQYHYLSVADTPVVTPARRIFPGMIR
jgi:hypothetical protein